MIIACATDTKYIRHCAVMLRSLKEANPEEAISVYIIHGLLDANERSRLSNYLSSFLDTVSFIHVDSQSLEGFPVDGHITIAAYYRLLLPAVLPHGVQKVLFLDCDLVIIDSLHDLWHTSLGTHPMGAVIDRRQEINCGRLGLNEGSAYFNSGVMLIDLLKWRESDVVSEGLAFVRSNPECIEYWDQDVLNHLFEGQWLPLDHRWNALPYLWGMNLDPGEQPPNLYKPAIVHFAGSGSGKPWNYYCIHPYSNLYLDLKQQTPWASTPLDDQPPSRHIQLWRKSIFALKCRIKSALTRFTGSKNDGRGRSN
jgi:lipopolysaccharide biosynthesis glycosyltransferase